MADLEEQGDQVGRMSDVAAHAVTRLGRRFLDGLPLALGAGREVRRRPTILLAVVILASLAFFSRLGGFEMTLRQAGPGARITLREWTQRSQQAPGQANFGARWLRPYRVAPLQSLLLSRVRPFAAPLHEGDEIAVMANVTAYGLLRPGPIESRLRLPVIVLMVMIAAAGGTLVLVGFLGWIRDRDRPAALSGWPRYWRAHYLPVLSIWLLLAVWLTLLQTLAGMRMAGRSPIIWDATDVVLLVPFVALMLAPFVVVCRSVGARAGIAEGWRLLCANWAAVLMLFVLFRVGYEVLAIWEAIVPWSRGAWRLGFHMGPVAMPWLWVDRAGAALLGLWVAYAFMEIARTPTEAPGQA